MPKKKETPEFKSALRVLVSNLTRDSINFDEKEGRERLLYLSGVIDDLYQDPLCFHKKKIDIRIFDIESSHLTSTIKSEYPAGTIGSIYISNLEQLQSSTLPFDPNEERPSHEKPSLYAIVGIPTIAISELHAQLIRCQSEERWLRLNLEFGVKSKQIQSDVDIESLRLGATLNQLLVDEKQAFNVFSVSTEVSKKKQASELKGGKPKPVRGEINATSFYVDIEKAYVSYNHGYDYVEQLQLRGTANIRENKQSQVTDALINLKELNLSVEKFEGYGAYDFFPSENDSEKAYLELTLYYQFEEFNKILLPALNSENLENISLRVRLVDKLSFSENQSGKVSLFTTEIKRTIAQVTISDVINEQKTIEEKFNNLSLKIKALNEEIIDGETKIKASLIAHENLISEKLRQLEFSLRQPNDLVSKLLFKIPILGKIIKYLIK